MNKTKILFFLCLLFSIILLGRALMANENRDLIHMTLKDGLVVIETRPDLAPKHVVQIKQLIGEGKYDGVVFHRVIEGFMAQTGDVEFGNSENDKFNLGRAGTGGSNLPDIEAEFSDTNHGRGTLSMARANNPNSANSQFFICFNLFLKFSFLFNHNLSSRLYFGNPSSALLAYFYSYLLLYISLNA